MNWFIGIYSFLGGFLLATTIFVLKGEVLTDSESNQIKEAMRERREKNE